MIRSLAWLAAAALAVPATLAPAAAQGVFVGPPPGIGQARALDGKRGRVARELGRYGLGGVDVARLSNQTVALLDNALHESRSHGDKAARLRSILSGGGILQRGLERLGDRL